MSTQSIFHLLIKNEKNDSYLTGYNYSNLKLQTKGQIKSEWIYEIVNQPKIATEKFEGFLP